MLKITFFFLVLDKIRKSPLDDTFCNSLLKISLTAAIAFLFFRLGVAVDTAASIGSVAII